MPLVDEFCAVLLGEEFSRHQKDGSIEICFLFSLKVPIIDVSHASTGQSVTLGIAILDLVGMKSDMA